uniref:Thyroid hormone receptor-associated protein 3-like n=1 Tax=Saccoglossus kowalevskii TaxID=10224 RepID=A0ABM0H1F5_SACKO|nr:PREDICTED: thyroid hormone receptor-associated protein 3-like [Saccoglossus kowalevskii]
MEIQRFRSTDQNRPQEQKPSLSERWQARIQEDAKQSETQLTRNVIEVHKGSGDSNYVREYKKERSSKHERQRNKSSPDRKKKDRNTRDLRGRLNEQRKSFDDKDNLRSDNKGRHPNPRDLRHSLDSRRNTDKVEGKSRERVSQDGHIDRRGHEPDRRESRKRDHDSHLPSSTTRDRDGKDDGKKRREDPLPDFKKRDERPPPEPEWVRNPTAIPKGGSYYEHDNRVGENSIDYWQRRGGYRGRFRGRGRSSWGRGYRGGSRGGGGGRSGGRSPQWSHDLFEEKTKKAAEDDRDEKPTSTTK